MKAEAAECVRTAVVLGLGSSDLAARAQLVFLEREACRWAAADEAMAGLRSAVQRLAGRHAGRDRRLSARRAGRRPARAAQGGAPLRAPRRPAAPAAAAARRARARRAAAHRLPLGRLPPATPTSQLMAQMLECHDRARFEVTLLSTGADDNSAMRQRMRRRQRALRGRCTARASTPIARRASASSSIDILVDLKGATHDTLMPVLAQRPAPLQVAWLGFPGHERRALHRLPDRRRGRHAARRRGALQREDRADAALLPAERRAPRAAAASRRAPSGACPTTPSCCAPSTSRTRSPPRCSTPGAICCSALPGRGAVAAAVERQRAARR